MAQRRYLNFDLLLEQEGDGHYQARVTSSPLADSPRVQFTLPFDPQALEILLLKLDPGRAGTRGTGDPVQQQAARDFGGPLFQSIFTGNLGLAWSRSMDKARAEGATGLRLRLRLDDAPALAGLPWELLYDAGGRTFPAQSERTPLVRYLDVGSEPEPMQVDGPLHVLAIISSPLGLPELDVEREWTQMSKALASKVDGGLVVLDRLPEATVTALGDWLLHHDTHVIHFVGHGDFDQVNGEGYIYFQDERGARDPVSADVLGPFIHDHDPLRMVVMNACRSARTSAVDPYGGMAQGLMQQGASAVIAMQFPITDAAAVLFTGEFYGAMAAGLPVDQAVSYARKALLGRFRNEWATPVLFMRSPDGNIFDNVHAVGQPPPPPPPPPPPEGTPGGGVVVDAAALGAGGAAAGVGAGLGEVTRQDGPEPAGPVDPPPPDDRDDPGDGNGGTDVPWVRAHAGVLAAVVGVLVVLVAAFVVVPKLGGDGGGGDGGGEGATDTPTTKSLPQGDALGASQVLVAAGSSPDTQHIFLLDAADPTQPMQQLTHGTTREWLPVLSPNRRTVIYSHRRGKTGGYQLRTARAADGTGDRPLFDETALSRCASSTGRPAWIPDSPPTDLVMRCVGDDGVVRLLRADINGRFRDTFLKIDDTSVTKALGDPTVSRDGKTVVYWRSNNPTAQDGQLFALDLASGESTALPQQANATAFSDPAFSPSTDMLAWRATVDGNFEVFAAPFVNGTIDFGRLVQISDGDPGLDQDPSFSLDGKQVVYGHSPLDDPATPQDETKTQQLWTATVADPSDRKQVSTTAFAWQATPSWSHR